MQVQVFLKVKSNWIIENVWVFENLQAKDICFTRVKITSDQNIVIIGNEINVSTPLVEAAIPSCS